MNHPKIKSPAKSSNKTNSTAAPTTSAPAFTQIKKIGVVGLGYVGLPLTVKFANHFATVGFDINDARVFELREHHDRTSEVSTAELEQCNSLFTTDATSLAECDFLVVTVPTPIDGNNQPNLSPVRSACELIGQNLKQNAIVVFESTVYPGVTEELCVPILERVSGMKWKQDFFVGYSPERINPGDKERTVDRIIKVVAGDTPESCRCIESVYRTIIAAGIHVAESIQVAEAAKVIENTQRDLNIALMNELSIIFGRLGISTREVLKAAGTKWNFLPFTPGLVGGHCIGVDPFYLTYCAERTGYYPQVILAGRRINDGMGQHVATQTVKLLSQAGARLKDSRVLILGMTFKENVPDIRNSKVIDIITSLQEFGVEVSVFDPLASKDEVQHEFGITMLDSYQDNAPYDAIVVAVAHSEFCEQIDLDMIRSLSTPQPVLIDVKWLFDRNQTAAQGIVHWQL